MLTIDEAEFEKLISPHEEELKNGHRGVFMSLGGKVHGLRLKVDCHHESELWNVEVVLSFSGDGFEQRYSCSDEEDFLLHEIDKLMRKIAPLLEEKCGLMAEL